MNNIPIVMRLRAIVTYAGDQSALERLGEEAAEEIRLLQLALLRTGRLLFDELKDKDN